MSSPSIFSAVLGGMAVSSTCIACSASLRSPCTPGIDHQFLPGDPLARTAPRGPGRFPRPRSAALRRVGDRLHFEHRLGRQIRHRAAVGHVADVHLASTDGDVGYEPRRPFAARSGPRMLGQRHRSKPRRVVLRAWLPARNGAVRRRISSRVSSPV